MWPIKEKKHREITLILVLLLKNNKTVKYYKYMDYSYKANISLLNIKIKKQ